LSTKSETKRVGDGEMGIARDQQLIFKKRNGDALIYLPLWF
jgi:hypothetical protein